MMRSMPLLVQLRAIVGSTPATYSLQPLAHVAQVRIIERFDVEVLEDAAIRGRLVFGLYGRDAPQGVSRFVSFIDGTVGQFATTGGGPAYAQSSFEYVRPGELLEGGRIPGLKQTTFAGNLEWEVRDVPSAEVQCLAAWLGHGRRATHRAARAHARSHARSHRLCPQYMSRLLPTLRPILEVNDLRHDRRGLLTRARFESGPGFGVTLGAVPRLDGSHEVIGELLEGADLLERIEALPYITGKSIEGEGSLANSVFQAQKSLFSGIAKSGGDARAEDRTGKLLRRVEITRVGML